jgi:hypothetical protein
MAEADVATQLSSLLQTVKSLNQASDDMNAYFRTIADELVDSGVGVEVWLTGGHSLSSDFRSGALGKNVLYLRQLGWMKMSGKWRFAVRGVRIEDRYVEDDRILLEQASRQERIAALGILPYLLEEIENEAAKALQEIRQATQTIPKKVPEASVEETSICASTGKAVERRKLRRPQGLPRLINSCK